MRKLLTFICTLLVAIGASATINRNLHASVVLEKKTTTENELNLSTVGIRQAIIGEVEMADEPTMEEWNAEYVAKQQKAAAEYAAHDYYYTTGMMHFGCTPQFQGLPNSFIAVPYLDSVVWTNYYGPTSWYMQHNDELVAENSETYVTGYGIDGAYYLPYTTDHTLTQNGQTYNIKGYKYAAGNENGGYLASAVSPIIISTGEMIPLTLCGMATDPMNNNNGSDFYRIGAGARGAYAYGTKLIADTATGATADTLLSTVRNVSPLKISAVNIPVYNNQGTTIMPEGGQVKVELFAADLTMGMIYTDSILATAVATIDNFQEVQTGLGTIVATFQEEDKFGGMMDVSIVVEGDFVVQLTGYNESGCDFGIYADYYTLGGTTMYKVGGKYTPIFSASSNLAISYDAYWPVAIASLSQEVLVAPVEGGVALDGEYSAFAIYTNVHNFEAWMIDKETSEWLEFSLDDSNLETGGYLIGQITAEALPTGMTGRKGGVVIDADGYKLSIPVIQGDVSNPAQTTITYELNGGVTNDDNWLSKADMWTAFCADAGISVGTYEEVKANKDPYTLICSKLADANVKTIMGMEKWDWLEAYVMTVQNADAGATALVEGTSSAGWRYAFAAFFLEGKRGAWPVSADFSVAGKVEAFQSAWKHGFANPTEPTGEWVLNAPYKEGKTFDGWYWNADFSGKKITTVNAETTGTLYAKWVDTSTKIPTKTDLADYYEPGQLCVCVYFEEEVCSDIVFAGSYNGWDTDPANMAKFAPLEGFNGWYYVAVTDESEEIEGKPVQLKKDGSFSWDYQTGDPASWTIVSGTVNISAGYAGEADLKGYSTAEPVIMISAYFKNHNTPCNAAVYHDYTIRLSAPVCASPDGAYYDPAIIGSFNGWAEGVACNDIDEETFDYIFRIYDKEGGEFKFRAYGDTDWSNQIQLQNEAGWWYDNPNIKLTAETEIYLDYSAGRFTLCVEQPEQNTYTLTVKSNNSSMGTVSGSGVYEEGENVQISATPHYGYHFSHWNDYNYDNPRQVQVTEDKIYTAYFYKNTYTIFVDYNSTYGTVTGPTSGEYQDEITLTATPNIGYEFVEWSDGVKDNSRTIVLNEDIYLSAYFAQAYSGQCGDNLYWKYDSESQTIAITGSGEMYHYTSSTQPWILFKEQIRKVEISNDATSLGTSAFEGCRSLGEVHIGLNLLDIYENVFAGCRRLYHIYSYPTYPPFADITSFANYSADVHIPCESYEWYVRDDVWGQFNIKCLGAEAEDVPTGEVTTTTTNTSVTITWPTDEDADTYTIEIKKGDQIFCTLTFSKDGQLTNIAFAPSRDGQHRAQYAEATTKGLRFTVTSLDSGTRYGYDITTKNENEEVIDSYSGEFTTKSDVATDIDNVTATDNTVQKLLRDNQLLILRNGKTYNTMGAEIR